MPENRCQTDCQVFKRCVNGELSKFVTERRQAEELRIKLLLSDEARGHASNAMEVDRVEDEFNLGTLPIFALKGLCKGPSLFKKTCQNPYTKQLLRNRANF